MSYKKSFKVNTSGVLSPISGAKQTGNSQNNTDFGYRNWGTHLPDVYSGHPNRIERYNQYESMDMDPEVNAALDIISEFSTQNAEDTKIALTVQYHSKSSPTENEIITEQLRKWYKLQEFDLRITKLFRNICKYGDQLFIRDPETFELYWVDMQKVTKIVVNESEGKTPEKYFIKDIDPNFQNLTATGNTAQDAFIRNPNQGGVQSSYSMPNSSYTGGTRFSADANETEVDAEHIVHFSLTEGLDPNWPFGVSLLETVFKTYKQKELLEDAILIYRVQRAPERRVFYIDVGNMPSHMAMQFVERVKNEIHQRRIPTPTGGSETMMDTTYNPLCLDLGTRIPLLDGRTLSLNELIDEFEQGKENWAYSCDPVTGKIVPGLINWAGITRSNAEVIKLTFDNGESLICTPDHKIPVFGKGFVEAKAITSADSLISFNRRNKSIAGGKTNEYEQVWDHESKSWVWTHRFVGEFFRKQNKHQEFTFLNENKGREKSVIHHKDFDRRNNDPRNLQYMNKHDHILYHSSIAGNMWKNMISIQLAEIKEKISQTIKKNWATFVKEIDNFNHKVVKIEKLSNRDVGTITIDGTEKWHDYHTFAIDSGIFVKNSTNEDYFFPQSAEGRGSKVETLPGGENLGQIDDLKFFNNKLLRGLRVPSSYLPTGPDDGSQVYSDGRVTTALIQEYRFNQYCQRLQKLIQKSLDREFKIFLAWRGYNIDNSLFEICFSEPMNFSSYRENELHSSLISNYTSVIDSPYLSKRFVLKKYLGLSDIEIEENENMLEEELGSSTTQNAEGSDLRNVGISAGDISGDMDMFTDLETGEGEIGDLDLGTDIGGVGAPESEAEPGAAPAAGGLAGAQPGGGLAGVS